MSHASKPAVVAHVYYERLALEILEHLSSITSDYTLFVTHNTALSSTVKDGVRQLGKETYFVSAPNVGRDIAPFLTALSHPAMQQCDTVLKLHTKRDLPETGGTWREECLRSLVGNQQSFSAILDAFRTDPRLMMVGPESTFISAAKFMYQNEWLVNDVRTHVLGSFGLQDWGFFAGTMFWARRTALSPMLALESKRIYFDPDYHADDGGLEHALERVFGLLPHYCGGRIALVSAEPIFAIEPVNGIGNPSKRAVTAMMRELANARSLKPFCREIQ